MNHFHQKAAAERYSRGRPDFHANTIRRIRDFLNRQQPLERALDVACGTGLSTRALLAIAADVYGTDLSAEMLGHAPQSDRIHYAIAPAEAQPFPDNYFDLVTVSSGVHWFAIDRFLAEARRILKPNAWLVLYENYFVAEMPGSEDFGDWFRNRYLKKFPSPPRNNSYPWTNKNLIPQHFNLITEEQFKNTVFFNKKQLILYFTSQSNIIAAVEKGVITYDDAEDWLANELAPYFKDDQTVRAIRYGNWIKFIQRTG